MQKLLMPFQGYKTYYCFFSKQYFSQIKTVICLGLREKFRFSLNVNRENKTKLTLRQKKFYPNFLVLMTRLLDFQEGCERTNQTA